MKLTREEETFARLLEGAEAPRSLDERRMGALVSALERARPEAAGPSPLFADVLRSRILREAEKAARLPWRERAAAAIRARNAAWRRSFRVVTATGLAAVLMLGSGAAFASAGNAKPGDWNYGLKRAREGARLAVTRDPLARGYLHLDLARTRLEEVRALASAGSPRSGLYVDALDDMDASTIRATELLVGASRAGAGTAPLQRLARFAIAQRLRLEALVDRMPPSARPAARDSLAVLVRVNDRVLALVAGCNCPGNPLVLPAAPAGSGGPAPCSCLPARPGSRPGSDPSDPSEPGSNQQTPPPGETGEDDPGADVLPGTDADEPVNDAVDGLNELLDGLGLPTVPASPMPTALPLPTPTLGL